MTDREAPPDGLVHAVHHAHPVEHVEVDGAVVVGAGVAGLSVALGSPHATVLTLDELGSTAWAQGGIAAAVGPGDSPAQHSRDTSTVSGGLAIEQAVDVLTAGGPRAIERLVDLGAGFDRDPHGRLRLGREAGHGRRRIVHADGDATGAEVQRTLSMAAATSDTVDVRSGWRLVDLVRDATGVTGVLVVDASGRHVVFGGTGVVLATGGIGQLYRHTTNPPVVTGDGLAAAARAGARLADLEFVQFHPTALAVGRDPMPLLTEALRGEGGLLVDERGQRFLVGVHPDAELAPRDVVARGIWAHRAAGRSTFLDVRGVEDLPTRFPTLFGHATAAGLDPRTDVLPVSPAAHYHMGGVDTDEDGRTSLRGLWAAGEVSSTGVHGANRLASNSLLEGLVWGAAIARDMVGSDGHRADVRARGWWTPGLVDLPLDPVPEIEVVRQVMWDHVGLVRTGPGLDLAREALLDQRAALDKSVPGRVALEVGLLVVEAARRRVESRGSHFRADHPLADPRQSERATVTPAWVGRPLPAAASSPR